MTTARHPYLRAYMAGITVPTALLLLAVTGFTVARCVYHVPAPVERLIVFPMAVVPNAWGLWNMLYVALGTRRPFGIGLHGALLPFLLVPAGFGLATVLGVPWISARWALTALPIVVGLYYLVWKHLVGYFNEVLGVAE